MKARLSCLWVSAVLMAVQAGSVSAHHSFAMFDSVKEQVLAGVVTEVQWTNPHIWIEIDAPDVNGVMKHWSIEGGSPLGLSRQGWKRSTIKPGDKISLVMHPLKSGEPGGSLMGVVTADGKVFGEPLTPPAKK